MNTLPATMAAIDPDRAGGPEVLVATLAPAAHPGSR